MLLPAQNPIASASLNVGCYCFPVFCQHGSAWGAGAWACFWILVCTRRCIYRRMTRMSFPVSTQAIVSALQHSECLASEKASFLGWPFGVFFFFSFPKHLLKQNVWFTVGREGEKDFWQVEKWKKSELCSLTHDPLCVCMGVGGKRGGWTYELQTWSLICLWRQICVWRKHMALQSSGPAFGKPDAFNW